MESKKALVGKLQKQIMQWEGYKPPGAGRRNLLGLGPLEDAFPNSVFPTANIHEFICGNNEQAAASGGLVSGILSVLMKNGGICVWIGRARRLYTPALASFGVQPHKVIFISLHKDKDTLWVMEEALKCPGLTAVVCELTEMDFKQSRRFQLAVEQSHVTGFVLRNAAERLGATACAVRWQVRALPSENYDGLPGLGFMRWQVDLLKVRNGHTGSWALEWQQDSFVPVTETFIQEERQVG